MKRVRIPLFTRARMAGETPECVTELPEPRDVRVFDLVFTPDGPGMMMKQRGKYFYIPFVNVRNMRNGRGKEPSPARETEAETGTVR